MLNALNDKAEIANSDLLTMLKMGVEQSFNAVIITDADLGKSGTKILYANPAFCKMTGYQANELKGLSPRILQGPLTCPNVINQLRYCLANNQNFHGSAINYKKDGSTYYVEWNISPVFDDTGKVSHFISIQQDISHKIASDNTEQLLMEALNNTPDSVMITDTNGIINYVNQGFVSQTGYSYSDILGQRPSMLKSGEHQQEFYQELWNTLLKGHTFRATFLNKRKNASQYYSDQSITPIKDNIGNTTHYVSVSKDLSERVRDEQAFREISKLDALTGVLIRSAGELEIEKYFMKSLHGTPFSLSMIDIDHFKNINDQWGHPTGDKILQIVAETIKSCLRLTDHVIRWGGEEFLLLFDNCDLNAANGLVERCRIAVANISYPKIEGVTISAGVAQLHAKEDVASLIARADRALYQSKAEGRNKVSLQR